MSRGFTTALVGGCAFVLFLDFPVFVASVARDLDGAYPAARTRSAELDEPTLGWSEVPVVPVRLAADDVATAPFTERLEPRSVDALHVPRFSIPFPPAPTREGCSDGERPDAVERAAVAGLVVAGVPK